MIYIKAKTSVRVRGISGPFLDNVSHIVNTNDISEAKRRFNIAVHKRNADKHPDSIDIEYIEIATEI